MKNCVRIWTDSNGKGYSPMNMITNFWALKYKRRRGFRDQ